MSIEFVRICTTLLRGCVNSIFFQLYARFVPHSTQVRVVLPSIVIGQDHTLCLQFKKVLSSSWITCIPRYSRFGPLERKWNLFQGIFEVRICELSFLLDRSGRKIPQSYCPHRRVSFHLFSELIRLSFARLLLVIVSNYIEKVSSLCSLMKRLIRLAASFARRSGVVAHMYSERIGSGQSSTINKELRKDVESGIPSKSPPS